ncbi:HAMP domain-containing sensor histidine kinase [Microbacterium profundi]|uniref:histidine kinase n=1 Tax=Microbacterium profundi TaxID=450380 RepID=A0ABV3LMQ9_9MICO
MSKGARGANAPAPSSVRYFGDSRCRSIWQWQLILAFTTVTIAVGIALLTPGMFADWGFSLGMSAIIVITIVTLAVPWHLLASYAVLVVPILDALAIGLLESQAHPPLSFLWVFPVAWVASYYSVVVLVGMLALVSALTLLRLFGAGLTPESTISMIVLLITLGFVGMIMAVGTKRNRSTRRLLLAQSARIGIALRRVTEEKARNQQFIDSVDIGVARVRRDGVVDVSNRAFRELYALDATTQFRPTGAVEYHSRRGKPIPLAETTIARASRGELFTDERVWLFSIDGTWRALKVSTQVDDDDSSEGRVLLLAEDVSTKVDARAGDQATRRTLSHELRNPLTAILGHVDILLEAPELSTERRHHLEVVERAGTRMQRLIDEALAPASHPNEDVDLEFDLTDIARASIEGFSPVAEAEGVTLKVHVDKALPMRGDEFRLRQVVDNVIGNAIKYAQRGGTVNIHSALRAQGEVALIVADSGIGISAEDLPHVFEPEFRTQLAREEGIPGTGLGLGISRNIVCDHGGVFELASELGQGTEVTLAFPSIPERMLR